VNEIDPTNAVVYDRRWFLETVRRLGLAVQRTIRPVLPGYQWIVLLQRRMADSVDRFPLGEESAEWVCGATGTLLTRGQAPPA
jgi:hypothetical protein